MKGVVVGAARHGTVTQMHHCGRGGSRTRWMMRLDGGGGSGWLTRRAVLGDVVLLSECSPCVCCPYCFYLNSIFSSTFKHSYPD